MEMVAVETKMLTKYYSNGRIKALEDLSLEVEKGTIFSLLGPNGSGKTTMIKLLLGICHPTRGTAKILGQQINDYKSHRQIGYLAENHHFPDFLNARQVLYYYGKMGGISPSILKDRIPQLLRLVKLEDWEGVKIRKYSKGMLQRLGIAQALVNDPELLFLDEPTDGIDPVGRREVRDILLKIREEGKSIFLNSHLLSEVELVSDEIAILKNGRMIQRGKVQDFISVKDTYQIQLKDGDVIASEISKKLKIELQKKNGSYLIAVLDDQHLNHFIDEIRNQNIIIQAVVPYKITLEDFFIEVIGERETPNE
jgi:ABC-2 type transport system ATP-binding protein